MVFTVRNIKTLNILNPKTQTPHVSGKTFYDIKILLSVTKETIFKSVDRSIPSCHHTTVDVR